MSSFIGVCSDLNGIVIAYFRQPHNRVGLIELLTAMVCIILYVTVLRGAAHGAEVGEVTHTRHGILVNCSPHPSSLGLHVCGQMDQYTVSATSIAIPHHVDI